MSGDDGGVYNPALAWSLGFDRDLVWGINLSAQCNETIRLRDELEARAAVMWEAEARDFLIMPSLTWTKDDISVALSAGIFGGDEGGQFGQFHDNSFVKVSLKYTF